MSLPWVPPFMTAALMQASAHDTFAMTAHHRFVAAGLTSAEAESRVRAMCAEADEQALTTTRSWLEAHRDVYARMVAEL